MRKPISVYDNRTRKRLAYLENAYNISYDKTTNTIWTASFSLPFSDPKKKHCQSFNYVEIWEESGIGSPRYVGLFRIMPRTEDILGTEANIVYQLEHVLTTLLDDVMIGYHEIGNLGIYTNQVLGYILGQQSDTNWVLGECAYMHQFLYGWQDENLLSALFSVVQPFEETDYYWDFDTTQFPWRLNLLTTNKEPVADIRYKKNLNGLTRTVDPTNLTTRLYCYGYGQGDNKLGIAEVNNGVPYLESPNISKYGIITQIWTDERFTIAESLCEVGQAMLKRLEEPSVSYEIDIQAIYAASNLELGDTVRMVSPGLDELMIVKNISKEDVTGAPQSGKILLGDATIDISNSIADLANRQRIAETYSQGAESIFTDSFADNADQSNPAEIIFTIPDNAAHVNEIRFSCRLKNFRAYSKAIEGGGSGTSTSSSGGAQTQTSSSGGESSPTSSSGGGATSTTSNGGGSTPTTSAGGGSTPTTSDGGGSSATSSSGGGIATSTSNGGADEDTTYSGGGKSGTTNEYITMPGSTGDSTGWSNGHDHSLYMHGHYVDIPNHRHDFKIRNHRHDIDIDDHTHRVTIPNHTHTTVIPNHTHTMVIPAHTHTTVVPAHTHSVSVAAHTHSVSLPGHTHGIQYGIYKGPSASSMTVYLDNTLVGTYSSVSNINLIDYMSKNANGNIMRGQHTIRIVPDGLTRIECTFQIRLFTNAHGGKQY